MLCDHFTSISLWMGTIDHLQEDSESHHWNQISSRHFYEMSSNSCRPNHERRFRVRSYNFVSIFLRYIIEFFQARSRVYNAKYCISIPIFSSNILLIYTLFSLSFKMFRNHPTVIHKPDEAACEKGSMPKLQDDFVAFQAKAVCPIPMN